jgi:ribosomal protein S12 methylthiotransferase
MVSLGCAKNRVDSERLAGALLSEGFVLTGDAAGADLALVNTCAFIEPARTETRAVLAELQKLKAGGRLRAVVAAGCYPSRWGEVPGADAVVPIEDYPRLVTICRQQLGLPAGHLTAPPPEVMGNSPRLRFGLKTTAFLKLSEGCSNRCAYCSIPSIRGPARSRPPLDVVREAGELVADGAAELILIAQDTAAYGRDLPGGRPLLGDLLRRLLAVPGFRWLRLMYAHPGHLTDDVIEMMGEPRIVPYLDMPIQHADNGVLAAMGRGYTAEDLCRLVLRLRASCPGIALRTTCLVGFPGENAAAFARLRQFLIEVQFDHLGAFVYSPEPDTPAAGLAHRVRSDVAQRRLDEIMQIQKLTGSYRSQERIGQQVTVLVEEAGHGPAIGRYEGQAPDVDGRTIITRPHAALSALRPGEFRRAVLMAAHDYDLVARLI